MTTPVPSDPERVHGRRLARVDGPSHLTSAKTVAHEAQRLPCRPSHLLATGAARGPGNVHRGRALRPGLDVDERMNDDRCAPLLQGIAGALTGGRASNPRLPSSFCLGRPRADAPPPRSRLLSPPAGGGVCFLGDRILRGVGRVRRVAAVGGRRVWRREPGVTRSFGSHCFQSRLGGRGADSTKSSDSESGVTKGDAFTSLSRLESCCSVRTTPIVYLVAATSANGSSPKPMWTSTGSPSNRGTTMSRNLSSTQAPKRVFLK
jgi:hypothetical protein